MGRSFQPAIQLCYVSVHSRRRYSFRLPPHIFLGPSDGVWGCGSGEAHVVSDIKLKNRCPCHWVFMPLLITVGVCCLPMFDAGDF